MRIREHALSEIAPRGRRAFFSHASPDDGPKAKGAQARCIEGGGHVSRSVRAGESRSPGGHHDRIGEIVTYSELEEHSRRVANWLYDAGLRPGDTVALMSDNSPRMFDTYWASQRSGLYLVPINYRLTTKKRNRALALPAWDDRVEGTRQIPIPRSNRNRMSDPSADIPLHDPGLVLQDCRARLLPRSQHGLCGSKPLGAFTSQQCSERFRREFEPRYLDPGIPERSNHIGFVAIPDGNGLGIVDRGKERAQGPNLGSPPALHCGLEVGPDPGLERRGTVHRVT